MNAMNWSLTSETLPEDGEIVLVTASGETWIGALDDGVWRDLDGMPMDDVTHWCELPEPA